MTLRVVLKVVTAAGLIVTLAACEGIKNQLGLTKKAPDEFRVVSRAPLTLPPDFSLRPPEPGLARPQEGTTADQARKTIFRADEPKVAALEPASATDSLSLGERSLLRSAGAEDTDPNIRSLVDGETLSLNAQSEGFIDSLIFWRAKETPGVVVDAQSEADRLRENAALGKGATSGQTPTIERRKKAFFEGIF